MRKNKMWNFEIRDCSCGGDSRQKHKLFVHQEDTWMQWDVDATAHSIWQELIPRKDNKLPLAIFLEAAIPKRRPEPARLISTNPYIQPIIW